MRKTIAQLAVLATLLLAAGAWLLWGPEPGRAQPAPPPRAQGQPTQQPPSELTIDDIYAQIANDIPGFAGVRLGLDGETIQVFFAGDGDDVESAALQAVTAVFQARGAPRPTKIEVLPAEYDFAELSMWYRTLTSGVWTVPGIVFTDIDEVRNRLSIGVETQEAWDLLERRLAELGIPREVVHLEISEPIAEDVGYPEEAD
ncbi:MAG: hypothetical protein WD939_00615 [Dehalococcoidia bacterium]